MPRFYAPDLEAGDETIALSNDEAAHLARVLRVPPDADVQVFNGRGLERRARVELADRRGVVLRITGEVTPASELPFMLTLAQSLLKGDAMDAVVRDAVMLGVTRIIPLVTAHADVSRAHLERAYRIERWSRVAVSSAKQCGRAVVPSIDEPAPLGTVLDTAPGDVYLLAEPRARSTSRRVQDLPRGAPAGEMTVCVGPEGGWSAEEIELARARGATLVTFGTLTLRADAAARTVLPVLRYVWGTL